MSESIITYEQARRKILDQIDPMQRTSVSIRNLLGQVTAVPIIARLDSPPFDNSAVDGYGVRVADLENAGEASPVKLALKGTIRAGDTPPNERLTAKSAFKILTGACVPTSVEAVVMREFCREESGQVFIGAQVKSGENIRRRGGEFLRGAQVADGGLLATPAVVALIANLGYKNFDVFRKPKAAVVTTGNELTKPGRELMPGKIYDSNSYAMEAALRSEGIEDVLTLHAGEDFNATKGAMIRALAYADIVISTGGVSVGEFDYVKTALETIGVKTELWRIAIKPGKPVYFGILSQKGRKKRYVFGLPGNPVSALVTYHQFVSPAIKKLRGLNDYDAELWMQARLTKPLRKKPGRLEFVRGRMYSDEQGVLSVEPTTGQDSHMLGGLANANALIYFPQDDGEISAGTIVKAKFMSWSL